MSTGFEVKVDALTGVVTVTGEHGSFSAVPQVFLSIAVTGYQSCRMSSVDTPGDLLKNLTAALVIEQKWREDGTDG